MFLSYVVSDNQDMFFLPELEQRFFWCFSECRFWGYCGAFREPTHEKKGIGVMCFKILQTRMHNYSKGSEMWIFVSSSCSMYCVSEQRRLWRDCAVARAHMNLGWRQHDKCHFHMSWLMFCWVMEGLVMHSLTSRYNTDSKSNMIRLMTKPTKWHVRPGRTQISLGIRSVWIESSLSTGRRKLWSLATQWVHSKDSDQTGRMPRLIWVFPGRTVIMLDLSWGG